MAPPLEPPFFPHLQARNLNGRTLTLPDEFGTLGDASSLRCAPLFGQQLPELLGDGRLR